MTSNTLEPGGLEAFTKALHAEVARAKTFVDIVQWLEVQPLVESVRVMDYLLKSFPPRREILVKLRTEDARLEAKAVTIIERRPDRFELHDVRSI